MNNYQESAEQQKPANFEKSGFHQDTSDRIVRVRAIVLIEGNVQGVGFRPFLYQLATEHHLCGTVHNSASGVDLEIEGSRPAVESFLAEIPTRLPPLATISKLNHHFVKPIGHLAFVIKESQSNGHRTALISPDVAVCDDCLHELFAPVDRRYRYPFINCTNCGPRYSIIANVPYDRSATSMSVFTMCPACQKEYDDPTNRRFHAQPNACHECGPRVWLEAGQNSNQLSSANNGPTQDDAIDAAARLLKKGAIVAIKGLGGFHLACDASNAQAVKTLRRRKHREEKPFALMVPDLETARHYCHLDAAAAAVISSCERPITLLPRRGDAPITDMVAPNCHHLGLMLPYTPLHYLVLFDKSRQSRLQALVMTSGNLLDEPIAIGNREARERLRPLADAFLLHNRDILARTDDSVVRRETASFKNGSSSRRALEEGPQQRKIAEDNRRCLSSSGTTMIRRSRGYVPAPIFLGRHVGEVLAMGAHLKNTIAVSRGDTAFLSQHIGDLSDLTTWEFLKQSVEHLQQILGIRPAVIAHDLHPDYLSTRLAQAQNDVQLVPVQHHHAHVAACMAEHHLNGPVMGVVLDGSGYGTDGRVWGCEILIADFNHFQRVAHLREVRLPGNEQAIKQPWRMALSYLDRAYGERLWDLPISFVRMLDRPTAQLLLRAARRGVNSPLTSSCGRLFDAVAALVGLRQEVTFEGQAAMELEMAMDSCDNDAMSSIDAYPMDLVESHAPVLQNSSFFSEESIRPLFELDPVPLITEVVADLRAGIPISTISRRFHQSLIQSLAKAVDCIARQTGICDIVLNGGCFQNHFLQKRLTTAIEALNLSVYVPRLLPPNDGGLSLGQVMVASSISKSRPGNISENSPNA